MPPLAFVAVAALSPPRHKPPAALEARSLVDASAASLHPLFRALDAHTQHHLRSVLSAMRTHKLAPHHFTSQDGYGHSDHGRDALDAIYATLFGCEAACVRLQFHSGTHAIACVLFGALRPGHELVSLAGPVYDTLEEVIGLRGHARGSLRDFGVAYRALPLVDGRVDFARIASFLSPATKMVLLQRSFGYAWRPSLTNADIARAAAIVKAARPDVAVFVDNCYGEFLERVEPVHPSVGADVMAGSLIKNLGGGIAPSGAYVAGRADLVEQARCRLAAPGVGGGATLGWTRTLAQGLFLAPGVVGEALKGGLLVADVMARLGYETNPPRGEAGFVRAVKLGSAERVVEFCRAVQKNGPVGAFFEPTRGVTEGYEDEVVFAQATFVDGSTSELSADGPMREPYTVFAQGGLSWAHWAITLEEVVQRVGWNEDG